MYQQVQVLLLQQFQNQDMNLSNSKKHYLYFYYIYILLNQIRLHLNQQLSVQIPKIIYYNNIMHQQQKLETVITALSSNNLSHNRLYHYLTFIVKTLDVYNSNPDILPSERFVPCCLFVVPDKIRFLLGLEENQILQDKPEKLGNKLLLSLYLKGLVKLLDDSSEQIKHIIVQGMSKSILLAAAYPPIIKKYIKVLLQLWSTSSENLETSLRCHVALSKYFEKCDSNMFMWGLRRMYVGYFEHCNQVSWRNYQHINFMINSFCEIIKFNTQRGYYVLFGYLRSICLELDKLNKAKRKEKSQLIKKLFSNQILNCFKLFMAIVTRVDSQDLTALIYPYCEMVAAYERITQSPEYIPLKLHLLQYELTIMESLGIFIPHTLELIQKLINSSVFNRKIPKKSEKAEANIELAYKLSKSQLTQALLINQLFRSLVTKIYCFQGLMCKNVYGVEVTMKLQKILKRHKFIFSEYQQQNQKVCKVLKEDSQKAYGLRAEKKMSLNAHKSIKKLEEKLQTESFEGIMVWKKMKNDEEQLIKNKLAAEQQENIEEDENKQQYENEDEEEVNSGWQQASQGASEMDIKQIEEQQQEQSNEDISYQGDPDPQQADEAVKNWSEEEWSSQNDSNKN